MVIALLWEATIYSHFDEKKMANQVKTNYGQNRIVHDEIAVDKSHLMRKQRVMNESKTIQFLNDKSHTIRNLFDRIF